MYSTYEFQMSTQDCKIMNRGTNLRLECVHMIPNEHRKTSKTHVLILFISRRVTRASVISLTLVRYLSRNHLVRNFAKDFRKLKTPTWPKHLLSPMEWLGATWLLIRWRSKRRVVECNGKQGGVPTEGWGGGRSLRIRPSSYRKVKPRGAEVEKESNNAVLPV